MTGGEESCEVEHSGSDMGTIYIVCFVGYEGDLGFALVLFFFCLFIILFGRPFGL